MKPKPNSSVQVARTITQAAKGLLRNKVYKFSEKNLYLVKARKRSIV